MAKVTIATWYERVNATWDAWGGPIPCPTKEEAERGLRRLYRFAMGHTFEGNVEFTSGRRYTWVRWRNGVLTIVINPNAWDGERGMIHLFSHWVHQRKNPRIRPHGGDHARIEIALIKEVLKRGWLGEPPAKTKADVLADLLPITLMDAACELDCSYRVAQGHCLHLIRQGRARWFRNRLIAV